MNPTPHFNAYLLTGSNQGNRLSLLNEAAAAIAQHCGAVLRKSSIYETAAWGLQDQPSFLNQVLHLSTTLSPVQLLERLLDIERAMGRKRETKWGPRTIDIDILLFENEVIQSPELTVPHPRMAERRFVLEPLHELAPHLEHPLLSLSITQMLERCSDPLPVHKFI